MKCRHYNLGIIQKFILCFFVASIWSGCDSSDLTAQMKKNSAPAFKGLKNGQYAYYHAMSSDKNILIGMLKINDQSIMCRLYDLRKKSEASGEINVFITPNGTRIVEPLKYYDGASQEDLDTLLAYITVIAASSYELPDCPIDKHILTKNKDPNTNVTYYREYAPWVPFFGLLSASSDDTSAISLRLVALGMFNGEAENIEKVFMIRSLPRGEEGISFDIQPKEKKTIIQERISYSLDENWIKVAKYPEQGILHETYWLNRDNTRVAMIGVEKFTTDEIPDFGKLAIMLLQLQECTLSKMTEVEKTGGGLRCRYVTIDSKTGVENFCLSQMYSVGENQVNTLTFSCLHSVYDSNKKYFDTIFDSVKVLGEANKGI
jgi:hypothetical protein